MNFKEKILGFAERRRAVRALERLDDRTLSDIGIVRADIRRAVAGR
jgi:uncharacterized protein YjiS (DUF1127 family)